MRKGFTILLISSLIINVFLGGIIVGNYLRTAYVAPPSTTGMFQQLFKLFPDETTQIQVAPLIQKHVEAIKMQRRQVKLARQSVYEYLSAPHFNPEGFSETLTKLRQERNKIQEKMHMNLVEIATQLNLEERKQLAELFKQHRKNLNRAEKTMEEE